MKVIAKITAGVVAVLLLVAGMLACGVRMMSDLAMREAETDAQLDAIRLELSKDIPVATTVVTQDAEVITTICPLEEALVADSAEEGAVAPEDAGQTEQFDVPANEGTVEQEQPQPQYAYTEEVPAIDDGQQYQPLVEEQGYQEPQPQDYAPQPCYEEPYYEEPYYEEPVYPVAPDPVPGTAGMNDDELSLAYEIFDRYNEWRVSQGLNPAVWDGACAEMAVGSARGCACNRQLIHRLGIPDDLEDRYSDILQYATWRMDPSEAVQRWAGSEGHNRQMRCATVKNAACGVYEEGGTYWFAIVYTFQGTNVG